MIDIQDGRRLASAFRNRIIATIFLVAVCCCTLVAAAESSYTVNVVADGKTVMVKTSEQTADVVLQQAGVTVGKKDKVNTAEFSVGKQAEDGNKITVLRAMPVTIVDDGNEVATVTVAGSVADALKEAGVTVRPVDEMNCKDTDMLKADMKIEIQRAFSVDVTADGATQTVSFVEGTVADLLTELNITLGENDEVSPKLDSVLAPGNTVKVSRVTYEERTATETIEFKTITKKSSSLYKGTTNVEQEGKNGKKTVVYKDKIVDGKVSKSIKLSQEILEESQNKIVVVGTKIKILSSASPISTLSLPSRYSLSDGIPTSAITTITGSSTAYYSKNPGAGTASGVAARSGYVAVNPNVIPYGTEMYVVSTDGKYVYGYCIAADTGGALKSGKAVVDVYMDTKDECNQWGRRDVCIYILNWGNGSV